MAQPNAEPADEYEYVALLGVSYRLLYALRSRFGSLLDAQLISNQL